MLMVNQLIGFGAGGGAADPLVLTFQGFSGQITDLTTYTFTSRPIGTASADRIVLVSVVGVAAAARTISSVTVGGITAFQIQFAANPSTVFSSIWAAPVPTGTTADVVVTWSGGMGRCVNATYSVTGRAGLVGAFDYSTAISATDYVDAIDIPANGCAAAITIGNGLTTLTWTNLTEDFDSQVESVQTYSGASSNFTTVQNGLAITANYAVNISNNGCVASWGPIDLPSRLFCGTASSTTDLSTYTFSSQNIGQADGSRLVVVHVRATKLTAGANAVSSMTIGGVSATKAVDEGASDTLASELWYAAVPTGTTGDVVVNFSASQTDCAVGVWALYNLSSPTPYSTGASTTGSATVNIPAYGQIIAGVYGSGATTWTGVIEDFDDSAGFSGGSRGEVTAATGATVASDGGGDYVVAAVWR